MLEITLKLPRKQEYVEYTGRADNFVSIPIAFGNSVVGHITEILSDTEEYIEVKGFLYKSGVDYAKSSIDMDYVPVSISILDYSHREGE